MIAHLIWMIISPSPALPLDYAFHNIGAPRGATEPNFQRHLIAPYTSFLKNGAVIQASVQSIDVVNKRITVVGHDTPVPFDYLVVATGSSYPFPGKVSTPYIHDARSEQHVLRTRLLPHHTDIIRIPCCCL